MRRRELLKAAAAAVVLGVGYASKAAAQSKPKMQKERTMAGLDVDTATISIEHVTIPSQKPFESVKAALERLVPRIDVTCNSFEGAIYSAYIVRNGGPISFQVPPRCCASLQGHHARVRLWRESKPGLTHRHRDGATDCAYVARRAALDIRMVNSSILERNVLRMGDVFAL
jgi:hypothetical protein